MKKRICQILFFLTVISCSLGVFAADAAIEWRKDYNVAIQEAKEKNLPVFLLFTNSKSCPFCREIEERIFSRRVFQKFCQNEAIPLKVEFASLFGTGQKVTKADIKQVCKNANIPSSIEMGSWPYVVFISPDGTVLLQSRENGRTDPDTFVKKYKKALPKKN
ncbi:MAG: thioredoxin family protein [Kiritimatiellales bacterium]